MDSMLDGYVRWIEWSYETFHLLVAVRKGSAVGVKCPSCSGNLKGLTTSQDRLGHKASTCKNNSHWLIHLWNDKLRECEECGGVIILATACRCKNVQRLCLWPAISTVMRHLLLGSFPQESVNYRGMMTGGKRRRRRWRGEARGRWQELNRNREREAEGCARDKCSSELTRPPLVRFSFHPDLSVHFPPERASAITQSPRLSVLQHRAGGGFMVGNVLRFAAQTCWTSTWFVKL